MREIKFRGKRVDTGEWVYGGISPHIKEPGRVFITIMTNDHISDIGWHQDVIPETVGQYTGLNDKNGVEIYEGDVVRLHQFLFDGNEYENELNGTVVYAESDYHDNAQMACYGLTNIKQSELARYAGFDEGEEWTTQVFPVCLFVGLHEESFEVIGNIHEAHHENRV